MEPTASVQIRAHSLRMLAATARQTSILSAAAQSRRLLWTEKEEMLFVEPHTQDVEQWVTRHV